ncbi:MAG: hypothetical protein KAT11_04920 [Phycisphaerae bacterium]|nr:hypothetical protein [Phycisphaerae bacterium]
MNRKQYIVALLVLILAGFIGGAATTWLFTPRVVFAATPEQGDPQVLRAQGFELVDSQGKVRAMLNLCDNDKGANLTFIDQVGEVRALLGINKDMPGFSFFDRTGQMRVALGVLDNKAVLGFSDLKGTQRVGIGAVEQGASLEFSGPQNSQARIVVKIENNEPSIGIAESDGKMLWKTPLCALAKQRIEARTREIYEQSGGKFKTEH